MPTARRRLRWLLAGACFLLATGAASQPAHAAGYSIPGTGEGTGAQPQSKLWYNDGVWRAILEKEGRGLHFWEFDGTGWRISAFVDARLDVGGAADVKWNGSRLFVLAYNSVPELFAYTYDADLRVFDLLPGFPVSIRIASGSEAMVLDQDSAGRLWATYEAGNGEIYVCWSTSDDHRVWNSPGMVIRRGVGDDGVSTLVAFDRKIGVVWSDHERGQLGFRMRRDEDPPDVWQSVQTVSSGGAFAGDHLNLKADGSGNLYCVSQDIDNRMRLHYRSVTTGRWASTSGVVSGSGTRGVVNVSDEDRAVYVAYTACSTDPHPVTLRKAGYRTLRFETVESSFISDVTLDNSTGTKQVLPRDCYMAMAEGGGHTWWNGWGTPPDGPQPPPPPAGVRAGVVTTAVAPRAVPDGAPIVDRTKTASLEPLSMLLAARPNPFDPRARLLLRLPQSAWARVGIFDAAGRRVALVHDGRLGPGEHTFDWAPEPGRRLASGVYFAQVEALDRTLRHKLVLVQ